MLMRAAADPSSDSNTVSLLASYIFTPFLFITIDPKGGINSSRFNQGDAPADIAPALRNAFRAGERRAWIDKGLSEPFVPLGHLRYPGRTCLLSVSAIAIDDEQILIHAPPFRRLATANVGTPGADSYQACQRSASFEEYR